MRYLIFTLTLAACHQNTYIFESSPTFPDSSYLGCYTDTSTRALPVNLLWNGATVEACISIAKTQGFKYAGVQYGTQCFAGDVLGYTEVPQDCDMPCQSDPQEICGGVWANSVYRTGL